MKHALILAIAFLTLASIGSVSAQSTAPTAAGPCSHAQAAQHQLQTQHQLQIESQSWPRRPFDVLSYDLLLDWRPVFANKNKTFYGVQEITLQITAPTDTILLDAEDMRIDSVWFQTVKYATAPQPDTHGQIKIPVPNGTYTQGLIAKIKIAYTRTSQVDSGIYFFPKGTFVGVGAAGDSVWVEEDLAYTMSEPLDAHKWMPCMDLPYDKALSAISIIVPSGISAQSNGNLDSVTLNKDGSSTYHWRNPDPISTYLIVANASKWKEWKDYYHRQDGSGDSVMSHYYAWQKDYDETATDGSRYNAQFAFRHTPDMLQVLSQRFGEYPFDRYGQVPVQPFAYGGMEHQTLTTVYRVWLRGRNELGIAHELTHQWFGDKTTCETWSDIWLNESFATFGELLWQEYITGEPAYRGLAQQYASWSMAGYGQSDPSIAIYDPPIQNVFNYATTYLKGSIVLHMLRRMVGTDTLFFHSLRDYSNAYKYSTANTAQFTGFMSNRLGLNLTNFFDEWIYGQRWPAYDIHWGQTAGKLLHVQIAQTQMLPAPSVFHMPVKLVAYLHGEPIPDTITVQNDQRDQSFLIQLSSIVDSVAFDVDAIPLSERNVAYDAALGVRALAQSGPDFAVRYEPGHVVLSWDLPQSERPTLRIVDLIGRVVREVEAQGEASRLLLNESEFANGSYTAILSSGGRVFSSRFVIAH